MGILIEDKQDSYAISLSHLEKQAQVVLNALDSPDSELSILLLDDAQIAVLNRDYLHREGPTNVIAFPMREGEFSDLHPELLGDVVISLETADKEGQVAGISMEARLAELLVHGILHLFGYDHEVSDAEAQRMEVKSKALLKQIRSIHEG